MLEPYTVKVVRAALRGASGREVTRLPGPPGWEFKFSPGVEFEDGSQNLQFRAGAGYEFEVIPSWAIVPEFNVEFVDGERNLIYGVSAQYAF